MGSTPRRVVAAAIGACCGLAASSLLSNGNVVAIAASVLFALAALLLARALSAGSTRVDLVLIVALAIAARYAAATLLHDGLTAMGRGGFVTGDDRTYADLSWRLVRLWRGESADFSYGAESYLLGTYVYLESAVFAVVGPNVLVVKLLNGALGGALVALVYDLTRRLFVAHRPALTASVLVALYPSLVLWSALNLKDSLALFLIASVLWLLAVFAERRTIWLIPVMYAPLVLMQDIREYVFVGLALVIPAGVIIASRGMPRWRGFGTASSVALSAALLMTYAAESTTFSTSTLATLELVRNAMGIGARTRIVDVPVVQVQEGQTYVVPATVASAEPASAIASTVAATLAPTVAPTTPATVMPSVVPAAAATIEVAAPTVAPVIAPTPAPTVAPTQRVVVVTPGAQLVVASGTGPSAATPGSGVVVVAPGDVIVVGGPAVTAAPASERKELQVRSEPGPIELGSTTDSALALRTLRYLPVGLAFVLFAPFPWSIERTLDALPMPEMLLWYVSLVAALVVLIRERRRWRAFAPLVLFVVGTLMVLALAEGNVGTLYRHRAMVIPFVVVAASPGLVQLLEKVRTARFGLPHRRHRHVTLGGVAGR